MADNGTRLKGVYGRPLAKRAGMKIDLTPKQMSEVAQIILESIQEEIKKDIAKAAGLRAPGEPVPLPKTDKFAKSFQARVKGASTIEITSTWPTAKAHVTPSDEIDLDNNRPKPHAPMEMWWLTRPKVPFAQIVRANGEIIVRTTPDPSKGERPWIHPGFRKYTFLERGLRKGRDRAVKHLASTVVQGLLLEYDLFG